MTLFFIILDVLAVRVLFFSVFSVVKYIMAQCLTAIAPYAYCNLRFDLGILDTDLVFEIEYRLRQLCIAHAPGMPTRQAYTDGKDHQGTDNGGHQGMQGIG